MLAEIISFSIFALLPINVISLSISMYEVEVVRCITKLFKIINIFYSLQKIIFCFVFMKSVTNFEPSTILFDVSCALCATIWPAFICYFASHVTYRILTIDDMVYNSNWPVYPLELRKYVILIIARSQQPAYFNGLGIIRCTLEIFGKVSISLIDFDLEEICFIFCFFSYFFCCSFAEQLLPSM